MTVYPDLGSAVITALGGLILVWSLGSGLDRLLRPWGASVAGRTFSRLTLGNTAVAVLTALVTTHGKTALVAVLPALLLLRGPRVPPPATLAQTRTMLVALALAGLLAVRYLGLVDPLSGLEFPISGDEGTYGRFVRHMIRTGVENYQVDALPGGTLLPEPYHYGDLWHAAFFARWFSVNSIHAYVLFSACFLWLNIAAGAAAIMERLAPSRRAPGLLWGAMALVASGVSWVPSLDLPVLRGDWWNVAPLVLTKVGFVAVWVAAAFLMWIDDRPLACAGSLLIASVLYLVAAPGVALAVPVLLALQWRRKRITVGELRLFFLCAACVAGWLWLLYSGRGGGAVSIALRDYYLGFEAPLRGFRVLASVAIKVLLSYVPLWAIWKWAGRAKGGGFPGSPFLVVLHAAALVAYAILHPRFDSVQHWSIVYVALGPPVLSAVWARCWEGLASEWTKRLVTIGLFLFLLQQSWPGRKGSPLDLLELERTRRAIGDLGRPATIGFIRDPSEMNTAFDRNFLVYAPIPELLLMNDSYNPICLSVEDIPEDSSPTYRALEIDRKAGAAITRFVSGLKQAGTYRDYAHAQAMFVHVTQLRWILLSPRAAMPPTLWALLEQHPSFVGKNGWRWHRVLPSRRF